MCSLIKEINDNIHIYRANEMKKIKLIKGIESCSVGIGAYILHSLQIKTFRSVDI